MSIVSPYFVHSLSLFQMKFLLLSNKLLKSNGYMTKLGKELTLGVYKTIITKFLMKTGSREYIVDPYMKIMKKVNKNFQPNFVLIEASEVR